MQHPHSSSQSPANPPPRFPSAWTWFVDDLLPSWVKDRYSPKESWKGKPFNRTDAEFFLKGIRELSSLFTEERPRKVPAYFLHARFRSSYLLYFLPLQAAKFTYLYKVHEGAIFAALRHGREQGVLRVADLGAGPGTASIAFLLSLMDLPASGEIPPIELWWVDTNRSILEDGRALVEQMADQFPKLRGKVTVKTFVDSWWKGPELLTGPDAGGLAPSLILMGHILNEAAGPNTGGRTRGPARPAQSRDDFEGDDSPAERIDAPPAAFDAVARLSRLARGGGLLMVEPAARVPAHSLSRLRNHLFSEEVIEPNAGRALWGPCPHAERCPLSEGRDWCHFSVQTEVPGEWFRFFSKGLSSERQWLKYSYIWVAAEGAPAERKIPKHLRLVISDPLGRAARVPEVLLCEPNVPGRWTGQPGTRVFRGDWVPVKEDPAGSLSGASGMIGRKKKIRL